MSGRSVLSKIGCHTSTTGIGNNYRYDFVWMFIEEGFDFLEVMLDDSCGLALEQPKWCFRIYGRIVLHDHCKVGRV